MIGPPILKMLQNLTAALTAKAGEAAKDASPDDSASILYASDNNKTVALAQLQGQKFALQQASLDREMQLAANLELSIEKLDTKLQVSALECRRQMAAEENRHVEKMAQAGKGLSSLQNTYSLGADLPAPEED